MDNKISFKRRQDDETKAEVIHQQGLNYLVELVLVDQLTERFEASKSTVHSLGLQGACLGVQLI